MTLSAESRALVESEEDRDRCELAEWIGRAEEALIDWEPSAPGQRGQPSANKHTRALGIRSRRKLQAYRDALQAEDPGCDDV